MKVLFDYQIWISQRFGGISRYFIELKRRINKSTNVDVLVVGNRNGYLAKIKGKQEDIKNHGKIYNWLMIRGNQLITYFSLLLKGYDIVHPTYYSRYILRTKKPVVITVYDMIHELFMPEDVKLIAAKRMLIKRSNRIIAISESTKRDIIRIYPDIPESKIDVIYISTEMKKSNNKSPRDKYGRYILYVGRREGYKNFDTFYKACVPILVNDKELSLVCAGGGPIKKGEVDDKKGINKRIHQIDCDDEYLAALYSNAICFVFPSLYEGFGIPTLEAFACGCPVVLSNTSSMPEVGGEAAVYFDPYNVQSIYEAVFKVIYSEDIRKRMVSLGNEQIKKFNWDLIAQQTVSCYNKVVSQKINQVD